MGVTKGLDFYAEAKFKLPRYWCCMYVSSVDGLLYGFDMYRLIVDENGRSRNESRDGVHHQNPSKNRGSND